MVLFSSRRCKIMRQVTIDVRAVRNEVTGSRKGRAIANALGVVPATVSYWLNDKKPLTLDRLNDICRVLGKNTDDFLIISED